MVRFPLGTRGASHPNCRAAADSNVYRHPEKVQFEWWAKEVINHDPASVKANSHFSFFFVNETRKNTRAFPSIDAMQSALIYNYSPVFTGPTVLDFQQCYFFE